MAFGRSGEYIHNIGLGWTWAAGSLPRVLFFFVAVANARASNLTMNIVSEFRTRIRRGHMRT